MFRYFDKKSKLLLAEFDTSSEQNASNNLGKNREVFIKKFLKKSLPSKLNIESGEILDSQGNQTGQLDIIIVRDDCPSLDFGDENTYLAEGVFGVIEVKSNLNKEKLLEASRTMKKIEQLNVKVNGYVSSGHRLGRPLRILFAYKGISWENIGKCLDEENINDLFDLICILENGVYITKGRLLYAYDKITGENFNKDFILETNASSLGLLYYYLIQYGTSFTTGDINIENYFHPLEKWGK